MNPVDFKLTAENARVYGDEVAVINTIRRLKEVLPTGFGDIHLTLEVYGHYGRFIRTTMQQRAIVDRRAPSFIGVVNDVTQSEETKVQERGHKR